MPTGILTSIAISIAISIAFSVVSMILFPKPSPQQQRRQQGNEPPPSNGTYNERQPVPPLRVIAGRCRVGGDYATLEEKAGVAYHIIVHAAHRIEGYVQHWLHDELVTFERPATRSPRRRTSPAMSKIDEPARARTPRPPGPIAWRPCRRSGPPTIAATASPRST
jgi:hypothetical protein